MRTGSVVPAMTLLVILISTSSALALPNQVFVSARSGNDANNCSVVSSPCQTLAAALIQVNSGGSIIVLDSGDYGHVTITQSVRIEASEGVVAAINPASGPAILILAGASDSVVLRGLTLNGNGAPGSNFGINVHSLSSLRVEKCAISGFGTGIKANAPNSSVSITDTIFKQNDGGLDIFFGQVAVKHCDFEEGEFGITVGNSGTKATVKDTSITGYTVDGVLSELAELNLENCLISNNENGVVASGFLPVLGLVRVSNCTITDNGVGITGLAGSILTRGNNTVEGNGTDGTFTGTFSSK